MPNSADNTDGGGFWQTVAGALAALARQGGGSLLESPMPELRYAAREWQQAVDSLQTQ